MGKIFTGNGWIIVVRGNEHPPAHVHVLHPDGKAAIYLDGRIFNSGVPAGVLRQATDWLAVNKKVAETEWATMNNPRRR